MSSKTPERKELEEKLKREMAERFRIIRKNIYSDKKGVSYDELVKKTSGVVHSLLGEEDEEEQEEKKRNFLP